MTGNIDFPESEGTKSNASKKARKDAAGGNSDGPTDFVMVMPGDDKKIVCKLAFPIALSEGQHFAFREGGRTVGHGVVTKVRAFKYVPSFRGLEHSFLLCPH